MEEFLKKSKEVLEEIAEYIYLADPVKELKVNIYIRYSLRLYL